MRVQSKRYKEALKAREVEKIYTLKEAIAALKKMPRVKFDESVEMHFNLNIDIKKTDQLARGSINLPHGTGKTIKILVICKGEQEKSAKEAGADFVGGSDMIDKISGGWFDFDKIICTPDMMRDLAKVGKVLGPKGLMPSPKNGTVTTNIVGAIKEAKAGKIDFKTDKQGGVHVPVGKISFKEEQIFDNASRVLEAVEASRPHSVKGVFIKSAYICSTMSPGMKLT